jgi:ribonuclease HI/pterin-4a-carbinolamine dehydratase
MWQTNENKLRKQFKFSGFDEAMDFVNKVAKLARSKDHHPTIKNTFDTVDIELSTHSAGNTVTDKDRDFAESVDAIANPPVPEPISPDAPTSARFVKLFGDGGSRGNPGPSASGYVLLDADDTVIFEKGVYLGITTNNQAEYQSLRMGLEEAKRFGVQEVAVYMDSLLVINQMKGIFKVRNRDLWPIHEAIKELAAQFKKVTYTHVPRELNKLADAQVNIALDLEAGK